MRLKGELRDAIESLLDALADLYPGQNTQALLADVLWSNVIRAEIREQADFVVEQQTDEDAA